MRSLCVITTMARCGQLGNNDSLCTVPGCSVVMESGGKLHGSGSLLTPQQGRGADTLRFTYNTFIYLTILKVCYKLVVYLYLF